MKNRIKTYRRFWLDDEGQDVAEYAMMLGIILVVVMGTAYLIAANSGQVFSQIGSFLH